MMASIENPTQLKVEHLLHNVRQLSPGELDEFTLNLRNGSNSGKQ